ncbi:thioesterase domain-containing protein, partial [Rhodococcus sp. NPDC059968]|uniref:thioesterase domain-containing protein n=1 Tax=Rhodococcus sp. NPDC059968 TaxID=3347017 RepID=UPI00366EB44D
ELDVLPLNPSGKLDRRALPAPSFVAREFRAPTNPIEETVAAVFAEILGLEEVGLDDDFFALGGNSLVAAQVVYRLRTELKTAVRLQWLFSDSTTEALACRIESGVMGTDEEGLGALLTIRAGAGTPLFCIHPIVGLSWCYSGLAKYLDTDLPLYGVQSPSILEENYLPASLEELADRYIREIRRVYPCGPYRLLGWSLGGVIAHAMAVHLQAVGEQVELLAMMDSFVGPNAGDGSVDDISISELLGGFGIEEEFVRTESGRGLDDVTAGLAELTGSSVERVEWVLGRLLSAAERNSRLMSEYRPARFDGDIVFFTAAADGERAAQGWGHAVTGAVHDHAVPATHWRMTSPDALAVTGQILNEALREQTT